MDKWQPIETAPKDKHITHNSSILLTDGELVFEGYCNEEEWVRASNENLAFATHWMPMPLPPKLKYKICNNCGSKFYKECCE